MGPRTGSRQSREPRNSGGRAREAGELHQARGTRGLRAEEGGRWRSRGGISGAPSPNGTRSPGAGVQPEPSTAPWSSVTSPAAWRLLGGEYRVLRAGGRRGGAGRARGARADPPGPEGLGAGGWWGWGCWRPGRRGVLVWFGQPRAPLLCPFHPIFLTCRPRSSSHSHLEWPHSHTPARLGLGFRASCQAVPSSLLTSSPYSRRLPATCGLTARPTTAPAPRPLSPALSQEYPLRPRAPPVYKRVPGLTAPRATVSRRPGQPNLLEIPPSGPAPHLPAVRDGCHRPGGAL